MATAVTGRDVFTTGQIARALRVAPRTVGHWIDDGHLKGYRLPGSKDRRVTRAALEQFVRESGMPVEWLADLDNPAAGATEANRETD